MVPQTSYRTAPSTSGAWVASASLAGGSRTLCLLLAQRWTLEPSSTLALGKDSFHSGRSSAEREAEWVEDVGAIRDFGLELQVVFNKEAVMVLPSGKNKATGLLALFGSRRPRHTIWSRSALPKTITPC